MNVRDPHAMRRLGRAALAAVAFLTRVPVDRRGSVGGADVGRGVVAFPVVGAAVGAAGAATAWALRDPFPGVVAAMGAVACQTILTGALHLDGLADTADGYGGANRERTLEIMRDHAIGTFGAVAIVVDLLLKTVVIAALAARPGGLWSIVAAGALSRAAIAVLGTFTPYARSMGGTGGVLEAHARRSTAGIAAGLGVAIAWACAGGRGLLASAAVAVASVWWARSCRRRLGGNTGDTLGAASEGTEILVLLIAAAAG